jgi:uncharacterized Zn-binding protein involved in type VI secretion
VSSSSGVAQGVSCGGVDLHRAAKGADRRHDLAGDLPDHSVGRERDAKHAPVTVLGDRFVCPQIQRDNQRS